MCLIYSELSYVCMYIYIYKYIYIHTYDIYIYLYISYCYLLHQILLRPHIEGFGMCEIAPGFVLDPKPIIYAAMLCGSRQLEWGEGNHQRSS